ncbi:MAG: hypothetical protein KAV87_17530 [Desulfobacteraceae bacterium]|nr:hypothetical protein [Desulfobacteraceae bacterium]
MQAAQIYQYNRTATKHDLLSIRQSEFVSLDCSKTRGMTVLAVIYLTFLNTIRTKGFSVIPVYSANLRDAFYHATGISIGKTSHFKYMEIFECFGFLRRETARIGRTEQSTTIFLESSVFEEPFLKSVPEPWIPTDNTPPDLNESLPEPTHDHSMQHRQPLVRGPNPSDLTLNSSSYSSSCHSKKNEKQRQSARVTNTSQKRERKQQILFSIWMVLRKDGFKANSEYTRKERRELRSRATDEIRAFENGTEISNHSGVNYEYLDSQWAKFPKSQKEVTVKLEILPYLLGNNASEDKPIIHEESGSTPRDMTITNMIIRSLDEAREAKRLNHDNNDCH